MMKTNLVFKNLSLLFFAFCALTACRKNEPGPVVKLPELVTDEVSGFTIGDAKLNATINNTGGANITQCGFVWSSTQVMPTLADKEGFTEEGAHNDQFSSNSIAFQPNKSYYVRAYATNSKGTAYGNAKLIVFDASENLYHTLKIGNQIWMLENLKTSRFADNIGTSLFEGSGIWTAISSPAYCQYDNNISYTQTYGYLYNWYAVDDAKGLAPTGWRIPTNADYNQLITTVNNGDVNTAGIVLKEATVNNPNSHWNPFAGINSTNASGFTALPGGYRRNDNGSFASLGFYGHFWIAGEANGTVSYVRLDASTDKFNVFSSATFNNSPTKNFGFSVRCVRDAQ